MSKDTGGATPLDFTVLNSYAGMDWLCSQCGASAPMFSDGDKFIGVCASGHQTPKTKFYGWDE